jgi:very-short-patch-repair endonuclease
VVEVDGESHFTDESIEYDQRRTEILEGYGLRVIRFSNRDVLENFDGVCWQIGEIISIKMNKLSSPLFKGG